MGTSTSRAPAILRAVRPRQWTKNLLVLAAPLAAGVIDQPSGIGEVVGAFVAFTLCASSIYLLNDVMDVDADRRHPQKRLRPVAAGEIQAKAALIWSALLAGISLLLSLAIDRQLGVTIATYLVLQIAYALWLKELLVIDLAIVAAGFLLRAIAGGVAADVPLSQWFLLVTSFGSLFMVAGKRYSELQSVGSEAGTRLTLQEYSESYLRFVWSLAAAVSVTAYSLWAFEISPREGVNWQAISIAPFVIGLLRYAVDIDRGVAGEPEDAVLRDPVLLGLAATWVVIFAIGVYAR